MRQLAVGIVFVALAFAQPATGWISSQDEAVHAFAPGVYYWQGDRAKHQQTNGAWIVFRDYVLVVEANFPWAAREILSEIKKTTDKPVRFVFNTHYHADHVYGNSVFVDTGAAVVSSQDCAEEMRLYGPADVLNQAKGHPERLEYPSVLFRDKMTFYDGEHRVELTHVGPSHTKGDAVAYLPKEKILFVGDLVVNWTYGNNVSDPDVDYVGWVRVLDQLAQWDVKILVPGHGALGTLETLRGQREYLNHMLQRVTDGIRAGKTAEQLAQEVDLSQYKPFGVDRDYTAESVRDMYRRLTSTRH